MLSIQVTVASGKCKWFAGQEPLVFECAAMKGCKPTVTRSWSGLPVNALIDSCMIVAGQEFCLNPPLSVGSGGSGSDMRDSMDMQCAAGGDTTFSVSAPLCGLNASAGASCTRCEGDS